MDRDCRIFIKEQISNAVLKFFDSELNLQTRFLIEFDENDKDDLSYQNIWSIIEKRSIETRKNEKINLELLTELLTTQRNKIPLYAKVIELEKNVLYKLILSKRFRKKKEVQLWHKDSSTNPFIKNIG